MSEGKLLAIVQFAYSEVETPMAKNFEQVLTEVMNFIQYNMDIDFADKNIWYEVYMYVESCYASTKSALEWRIEDLRNARYELIMLESRVHRYEKEIECMGLNPNDF